MPEDILNNAIAAQGAQTQVQEGQTQGTQAQGGIAQGQSGNAQGVGSVAQNGDANQQPQGTEPQGQEPQSVGLDQLNMFANSILAAQAQREQEFRAQLEAQAQAQGAQQQEVQIPEDMRFIAETLGISTIKEEFKAIKEENTKLKEALDIIQAQTHEAQIKAQVADMESRIDGFSGKEVYGYLTELNKTNPTMAQALDNPQGWEMIHKSLHPSITQPQQAQGNPQGSTQQVTQPQPDIILNGTQNSNFEPNAVMDKIKSGNATYADMGRLFA